MADMAVRRARRQRWLASRDGAAPRAGAAGTEPRTLDPRFAAYQATGDRALRNQLVEEHRWLAVRSARRFARKGEPLADLVQVALVAIVKAVDRFDPGYGVQFSTFAVPTIEGELRRHLRDRAWSVHVPRDTKERCQVVSRAVDELSQALTRSPSVPEIARHAGTTVEQVLEALEAAGSFRGVALSPLESDRDEDDSLKLSREERGYAATEARMVVSVLLPRLPTERDRLIIRRRFFDGRSQSEIAAELGISQVHVSRLLRINLDRMRRHAAGDRDLSVPSRPQAGDHHRPP
jgi:RNA polymerase sigma-B factor